MKRIINTGILIAVSTLFIASSCTKIFDCIRGNNIIATESRNVSSFNAISSQGSFNVYVSYDSVSSLEIKAEENIIPYINTYVRRNTLYLEVQDNRCIRENQPVKIYVNTNSIEQLSLLGSGSIDCSWIDESSVILDILGSGDIIATVNVDYLEANVAGSGEIRLYGFADRCSMDITGSGDIAALNMESNECFADIAGTGDMYVWVNDLLDGEILGTGNIYYTGNPSIDVVITGTGNIYRY